MLDGIAQEEESFHVVDFDEESRYARFSCSSNVAMVATDGNPGNRHRAG